MLFMRVGIFFGGPSRERETSFIIGRTVFDKLDRALFEPVPLFVDSYGQVIHLNWRYLYKRSIQDFFPPVEALPEPEFPTYQESLAERSEEGMDALREKVGRPLAWSRLAEHIDLAFVTLPGEVVAGESLHQKLEKLGIPYTGSNGKVCRLSADQSLFRELLGPQGLYQPPAITLNRQEWLQGKPGELYQRLQDEVGLPCIIRPATATNACGATALEEASGLEDFELAVNRAFFRELIPLVEWKDRSAYEREEYIRLLSDLKDGLGFPVHLSYQEEKRVFLSPKALLEYLNEQSEAGGDADIFLLERQPGESRILIEAKVQGQAFACTVLGSGEKDAAALLPMPIMRGTGQYGTRVVDEVAAPFTAEQAAAIQQACEKVFLAMGMQVFAQAEGLLTEEGQVYLAHLHPALPLLPESPVFTQAADIALSPTALMTFMIRASIDDQSVAPEDLAALDQKISAHRARVEKAIVLLDERALQRPDNQANGRHIFELLDAAVAYAPRLAMHSGDRNAPDFRQVPLSVLYGSAAAYNAPESMEQLRQRTAPLTEAYSNQRVLAPESYPLERWSKDQVAAVFIAGEEKPGWLRWSLKEAGLPHSGTKSKSSELGEDYYKVVQTLRRNGLKGPSQLLLTRKAYEKDGAAFFERIESQLAYPLVAKLADRKSGATARRIENRAELEAYTRLTFRPAEEMGSEARRILGLKSGAHMPRRDTLLVEEAISDKGAVRFLEIQGSIITHFEADGSLRYELFEPAERLPAEAQRPPQTETFVSADGYLLTPARFSDRPEEQRAISSEVKKEIEKAARTLNLQGYATLEAMVRVYEDQSVDTIITGVDPLPSLATGSVFFQQAVYRGYTPETLMRAILVFGQEREELAASRAARREAYDTKTESATPAYQPPAAAAASVAPEVPSADRGGRQGYKQPTGEYLKERAGVVAKEVARFFRNGFVLRNLLGIIAMVVLSLLAVRWSLSLYTNHGESIQVPDFTGMDVRDAQRKAEKQDFRIVVIDSFFDSGKRPNTIYQQSPDPLQRAKEGRTIYVSKYRVLADSVLLPSLISAGYNYDQYSIKLKRRDIEPVVKERVFDNKQEANSILYFYHKGRKITEDMLKRGVKVPKGATLEFVITERITDNVPIPDLVCKRYDAAAFLVTSSDLTIGETIGADGSTQGTYVYRQEPAFEAGKMVPKGTAVTLYLSPDRPAGCASGSMPGEDAYEEEDNPLEEGDEDF